MTKDELFSADARPVSRADLANDLRALGVRSGELLVVHASLSALGVVIGGAHAVLEALGDVLGAGGTLMMPSHNRSLGDPARWTSPPAPAEWVEALREHRPAFDRERSPSEGMGAIAELFRSWPGVLRSDHPCVSFCARGPLADELIADHDLESFFGERSPLGAVYGHGGRVLLLGVGHGVNSSLHVGEYRALWSMGERIEEGARLRVDGVSRWVAFQTMPWDDEDFAALGAAFEAEHGASIGPVGAGVARLLEQRPMVDFAALWIARNRRA
jgi:aminoglycoside 3-N-acetyltransferase